MHACLVAQLCPTLCDPMTATHQSPLFMGFSPQENWSGLPFPPPRDLPDPGIELVSPAGRFFTTELLEKPRGHNRHLLIFDGHP